MRAAASLEPGAHHRALPSLDGGRGPKAAGLSRSFWEPQPPWLRAGVNARVSSGPAVSEVQPQRVLRGAVSEADWPAFRVIMSSGGGGPQTCLKTEALGCGGHDRAQSEPWPDPAARLLGKDGPHTAPCGSGGGPFGAFRHASLRASVCCSVQWAQ